MSERQISRRLRDGLALLVTFIVALSAPGVGRAADPPKDRLNPNERLIEPKVNVLDKDEINTPDSKLWVLHFIFKDPRVITVDIPGRGRRVAWYLPYYVVNKTKEPHTFIPDFELVADDKDTVHLDQILPTAQEEIIKLEDAPTKYLKIKNSVQMAGTPIPPSKENADPTRVAGVAIWDDVDPETSHFYIYVSGLSNGWSVSDPPPGEKEPVVRRKTLRLEFSRKGDPAQLDSRQIKYEGASWVYRGSKLNVPGLPKGSGEKPAGGDKPAGPAKDAKPAAPVKAPMTELPPPPAKGVKLTPPATEPDPLLEPPPPIKKTSNPPRGN
jgi:hypothetical protein